jgi:hypothetical protein
VSDPRESALERRRDESDPAAVGFVLQLGRALHSYGYSAQPVVPMPERAEERRTAVHTVNLTPPGARRDPALASRIACSEASWEVQWEAAMPPPSSTTFTESTIR